MKQIAANKALLRTSHKVRRPVTLTWAHTDEEHTMRRIAAIFTATLFVIAAQACGMANILTKQNQADAHCAVSVKVFNNAARDFHTFTVSIPNDDQRLRKLSKSAYVLGTAGQPSPIQVRVPVEIMRTTNGTQEISVSMATDHIHDSFLQLDCFREDPALSSLDTVYLDLGSYAPDKP